MAAWKDFCHAPGMWKGFYWSGTSGLVLPVPNKQAFPPDYRDKSRLCYYASLFSSIEVNSSFYKVPQAVTINRWARETPADFRFTFKLHRDITHVKQLAFDPAAVHHFMNVIDGAGSKKGSLLIQFPPSTTVDAFGQLEALLDTIGDHRGWRVALEFRHPSWYIGETYELADEYRCSVVLHDIPKSRNSRLNAGADFVYLRFHGPAGDYRGGYTPMQLEEYAASIRGWLREGKEVFVYFNNTIGDAVANLGELDRLVREHE
ncbi:DUF72 domain-containing protein [Chitinophaga horti]|uniref:DUF72 domain-containing protein n=1 Tax=Chitinophaga horti TaxID=2920382 RepID=A0ABY6J772_9BACT|nr:DUF72 domain-containing protein [Chitinophaga horti]UYQ95442.1 DUF72 domain-containing protein [Chitinophaga horti]